MERWLIGELYRLPGEAEDRCPELGSGTNPPQRRWDVGPYAVLFHVYRDPAGTRIAMLERIVHGTYLDDWLAEQLRQAED